MTTPPKTQGNQTMPIAMIQIPHRRPAALFVYPDEKEIMQVAYEMTEKAGEEYPATIEEAIEVIGHDLNSILVIETAEDIEIAASTHRGHDVVALLDELREVFKA